MVEQTKEYYIIGATLKDGSGIEWSCPRCNDTNIDYPGERNCLFCNTLVTVAEPDEIE